MATFKTFTAIGMREDLSNTIYNIAPTETPVISSIGKTKATARLHQWQTDTLDAATNNALIEGADALFGVLAPTVNAVNATQIAGKTVNVSGSLDAVDKAGRKSETAYQLAKAGQELKRDMEKTILGNVATANVAGAAPLLASIQTWIRTNWTTASTPGAAAKPAGVVAGATTRTPSTVAQQTAFSEAALKIVIKKVFEAGGTPSMLVVPPTQKQKVSAFTGIAEQRYAAPSNKQTTIIGAADVYLSDFGTLSVVPDRFMTPDVAATGTGEQALVLDPTMLSLATLRPFQSTELAQAGDATKHQMLTEYTLQVNNEAAHGIVADLTI